MVEAMCAFEKRESNHRIFFLEEQTWIHDGGVHLEFVGDNKVVIDSISGEALVRAGILACHVSKIRNLLPVMYMSCGLRTQSLASRFFRHQKRDHNSLADALANQALDSWNFHMFDKDLLIGKLHFRVRMDGASRGNPGPASIGWALFASAVAPRMGFSEDSSFDIVCKAGRQIGFATSVEADATAALECVRAIIALRKFGDIPFNSESVVADVVGHH